MRPERKSNPVGHKFIAGAFTGVITKTITAPIERMKILFQVQGIKLMSTKLRVVETEAAINSQPVYGRTLYSGFSKILRDDGARGLWRGNYANCIRVMPTYAVKFGSNSFFRGVFKAQEEMPSFLPVVVASLCAGATTVTVTYPLELIRTRLAFGFHMGASYNGIFDVITKTWSQEGLEGFLRGYRPTLVSGTFYIGIQLSANTLLKQQYPDNGATWYKLVCGAAAGVTAQTLTYPGDVIRRRMQANGMMGELPVYNGILDCIRKTLKLEGYRGFFRGLHVGWLRVVPGTAIQFTVFDMFSTWLAGKR